MVCHGSPARVLLWAKLPGRGYVEPTVARAACVERDAVPCLTLAPPIEILVVDDQRAILAGVSALIESEGPSMRVTGRATTGREALDMARGIQPHVIILDVDLGGEDGLALIPLFRCECDAKVIVFTCLTTPDARALALKLGAHDFVSKAASGAELIAAVRSTAD